jgi:hypothetical protein
MPALPTAITIPIPGQAFRQRFLSRYTGIAFLFVLAGIIAGFAAGWRLGYDRAADRRRQLPSGSILCKPGPWGDLSYTPFTIAAPDDLLPIRAMESDGTRWFLKGYTADSFVTLLQSTSLNFDLQHQYLAPSVLHVYQDGIELTPTADLVFALPDDARTRIYTILAQFPENDSELHFMSVNSVDEHFVGSGVSSSTMALFRRLCCQRGNYLVFSGVSAILSRLPNYDDKLRFVKALTRERTMLLRLHITPKSDVDALTEYWGKGTWNTDVRTILQSLTQISDGTWMNILMVMPPLPTEEIYDYPTVADNPLDGPPVNRDCHWTSLNFFRDVPDNNFGKPNYGLVELKENYSPVQGDPSYGDVVLFAKPDGAIIHSAVYIADDICFTKNGATAVHPWMLATVSDLIDHYSFELDPGQKLSISYFRNKRL